MTREDRWIISLDEIRALRWECKVCHIAISFPMNQTIRFPAACPNCKANAVEPEWKAEHHAYTDFVNALKTMIELQESQKAPGTVRLEFLPEHP